MAPNKRDTVQVAIRIRPLSDREKDEKARVCTRVNPGLPQVAIGEDKSFTYDHVFDQETPQYVVYDKCIRYLVKGTFEGFNATVLAYGQTGSGKTYTMGTGLDPLKNFAFEDDRVMGIVPRAARQLFATIQELKQAAREAGQDEPVFELSVQFVELYNDDIIDLLAVDRSKKITIHEDPARNEIYLKGVASQPVRSEAMIMEALRAGAIKRTTAATNMNQQSSRSHAIFTIMIKQQRIVPVEKPDPNTTLNGMATELEVVYAKFHFVDLAGSERLKRTGATGDRAREAISINLGLSDLGNVINALCERNPYVPYRNSKLTRLLQDSLGGNSRTLMIACASPSDADAAETLNTFQYANRAKNIQNKAVANQHKPSHRISQLEAEKRTYIDNVRSLEAEKERLEAKTNDFRKQIESLKQEKAELMIEKDKAVSGFKDLQSRVRELEKGKNNALADVQNITARFNNADNARQLLETENDDLKAQVEQLRRQLDDQNALRTELENRLQDREEEPVEDGEVNQAPAGNFIIEADVPATHTTPNGAHSTIYAYFGTFTNAGAFRQYLEANYLVEMTVYRDGISKSYRCMRSRHNHKCPFKVYRKMEKTGEATHFRVYTFAEHSDGCKNAPMFRRMRRGLAK